MKISNWKYHGIGWLMAICLPAAGLAQSKTVRGDNRGLPLLDYSKTFEPASFSGFNHEMKTQSLEMKAVALPEYLGNLKPLPLTEWQSSRSDIYPKTVALRDFEVKKAVEKWSRQSELKRDSPHSQKEFEQAQENVEMKDSSVETSGVSAGPNLEGMELLRRINRGSEVGEIKVGRGFGATQIKPSLRGTPETKSPPKSGSSR